MTEKWWRKKWYWMLCILLAFILVPAIHLFFFPEISLSRSLIYAVASSVGVLLAYFAYMKKTILKIQPKTLRRIITIMGGASIGLMIWGIVVLPLVLHFQFGHPIIVILLGVALVLIFALILDTLGRRREYEPLISGRGNI
jgi:hypothetical protein